MPGARTLFIAAVSLVAALAAGFLILMLVGRLTKGVSSGDPSGPSVPPPTVPQPSTTTTLSATELEDALIASLAGQLTPALDYGPDGVTGLGTCFAVSYVTGIGSDRLVAAGLTPETITMAGVDRVVQTLTTAERATQTMAGMRCGLMVTSAQLRNAGVSDGSVACFASEYGTYVDEQFATAAELGVAPLWLTDEEAFDEAVRELYRECLSPEEYQAVRDRFTEGN